MKNHFLVLWGEMNGDFAGILHTGFIYDVAGSMNITGICPKVYLLIIQFEIISVTDIF